VGLVGAEDFAQYASVSTAPRITNLTPDRKPMTTRSHATPTSEWISARR